MIDKPAPWWHPKFNILGTRCGRLTAFFLLYLTEGIPNGFALLAIVTQMRRQGVSISDTGGFATAFVLPWAFKWVMGPFVDLFYSDRWGRRRLWILVMQVMMCVTLLAAVPFDIVTQIKWLSALIIIHNVFAATQDVAIDALACGTLEEHERGLANGLMFAGSYCGAALGGSGVLFLLGAGMSLSFLYFAVIGCILLVTFFVTLRLQEKPCNDTLELVKPKLHELAKAFKTYGKEALVAFFGSRVALVGLIVAMLPMGAYALSLVLCSNLSVELGMNDTLIAKIGLLGTVIVAPSCVLGGYLSDKFGRRKMLMIFVAATAIPTLMLAWGMYQQGWIMPVAMDMPDRPVPSQFLLHFYIGVGALYSLFTGLAYGTQTALFMDICHSAVAATQFTAYMAMLNLVTAYSTKWQCAVVEKIGYPKTLMLDVALGMVCLIFIPFMKKQNLNTAQDPPPEGLAGSM